MQIRCRWWNIICQYVLCFSRIIIFIWSETTYFIMKTNKHLKRNMAVNSIVVCCQNCFQSDHVGIVSSVITWELCWPNMWPTSFSISCHVIRMRWSTIYWAVTIITWHARDVDSDIWIDGDMLWLVWTNDMSWLPNTLPSVGLQLYVWMDCLTLNVDIIQLIFVYCICVIYVVW